MTDNEIIKALECCGKAFINHDCSFCNDCLFKGKALCQGFLLDNTIGFINRQKAEIERLQSVNADMQESLRLAAEANKDMQAEIEGLKSARRSALKVFQLHTEIRAEAIKEFAERLKIELELEDAETWFEIYECGLIREIDNLVKEMIGDQKNER